MVFIHIRKTAGTSFRLLAAENYGPEHVYWSRGFAREEILNANNCYALMGHFNYPDVKKIVKNTLFAAVVRDPTQRIVSLYNHHCTKENWAGKRGFDTTSLEATLSNCEPFRILCANDQCIALCGKPNFETVYSTLKTERFIIGAQEELPLFVSKVANILSWPLKEIGMINTADQRGRTSEITGVAKAIINELTHEDQKLVNFVRSQHVLTTPKALSYQPSHSTNLGQSLTSQQRNAIKLERLEPELSGHAGSYVNLSTTIINSGNGTLRAKGVSSIRISYHLRSSSGIVLEWDGVRTEIPNDIAPHQSQKNIIKIKLPKTPGNYIASIDLLQENVSWFEKDSIMNPHLDVLLTVSPSPQ